MVINKKDRRVSICLSKVKRYITLLAAVSQEAQLHCEDKRGQVTNTTASDLVNEYRRLKL